MAAVAFVIGGLILGGAEPEPAVSGSPAPSPIAEPADSPYRPAFHITPERAWMNDPQRPFFLDGRWHLYYLYNADYPAGNGTEWYHLTSTDLVTWKDEGVAVEKYRNGLGDIQTGSAVVDTGNTAGFGEDAVVAVLTQQHDGVQRQSLFYSTDGGYTFQEYEGNPVMDNPGAPHWRDPKIVRDDAHDQWVMVLAEGHRLGFYTSQDLKSWRYVSDFVQPGLGLLECPDLFQLDIDGDPDRRTWVLATSANGEAEGRSTGLAYWTGSWDGESFTADGAHQWLDGGSDFYAGVTWAPAPGGEPGLGMRHALGWMNNWAYARDLPTQAWQGGAQSVVRDIRLAIVDGRPTLVSEPTAALASLEGEARESGPLRMTEEGTSGLPEPGETYRLDVTLERRSGDTGTQAHLRLLGDGERFITVGYDFAEGKAFIARDLDRAAEAAGPAYRAAQAVTAPAPGGRVRLTILVDRSSVEVFVNDGEQSLSSLAFPTPGARGLAAVSVGGDLTLARIRYAPLTGAG